MARQIITSIEIDAPPHIVWEILVALDRFDLWNPLIRSISSQAVLMVII